MNPGFFDVRISKYGQKFVLLSYLFAFLHFIPSNRKALQKSVNRKGFKNLFHLGKVFCVFLKCFQKNRRGQKRSSLFVGKR